MSTTEEQQPTLTETNLDFKDVIPGLGEEAGGAPTVPQAQDCFHGPTNDVEPRPDNDTGPTPDFQNEYKYKQVSTDETLCDDFTSQCNVTEEPKGSFTKPSTVPDLPSPSQVTNGVNYVSIEHHDTNQDTAVPGILDVTDAQDPSQETQSEASELNASGLSQSIGLEQQKRVDTEKIDQATEEEELCTPYPQQVTEVENVENVQQPQDDGLTQTVTSRSTEELEYKNASLETQNLLLQQTIDFQHQQISGQNVLIEQLQYQLNCQYQQIIWLQTRNQMLEQNRNQTLENNQFLLDLRELLKQIKFNKNLSLTPEQEKVYDEITILRNDVAHPSDLSYIRSPYGFKIAIDYLLGDAKITEKQAQVLLGLFDSWSRVCGM